MPGLINIGYCCVNALGRLCGNFLGSYDTGHVLFFFFLFFFFA